MSMVVSSLCMLVSGFAWGMPDSAFDRSVDLVDRLYLDDHELDPQRLLLTAAERVAEDVHWLMVEARDGRVVLRHGDGTPLGEVSVDSMEGLTGALLELRDRISSCGYSVGDVDVGLSVLAGMADGLDRNTKVMAGDQRRRFGLRLKGEGVGIGAELHRGVGGLVVADVQPGRAAELGGLLLDDLVVRIDDHATVNMPEHEAQRLLGGEEGTQVVLSVRRGERALRLPLTRELIVENNVRWRVLEGNVGLVSISHISQRTVYNLQRALERLRARGALQGIVVDLRGNTGGSMPEAARSADEFVSSGVLLRTLGRHDAPVPNLQAEMVAHPGVRTAEPDGPMVVLVDERTASGSEILAGALLELERAVLIGTRTYGKGTVQKLYPIDRDAQLKLTVAQYVLANDRRIAGQGLVPDVVVGDVVLDAHGVRYQGFDEGWTRTRWTEILPRVVEHPGWRGRDVSAADLSVELARQAVLAARGGDRSAVLEALRPITELARAEQERHLANALEQRGIDWSAAPSPQTFADAEIRLKTELVSDRTDVVRVIAEVHNHDERDALHRALVQLDCATFSVWDERVIPVGRVAPGATAKGEALVPMPPGVRTREDEVVVRLRADGVAPFVGPTQVLEASSSPVPRLEVSARLVPHGDGLHRAELELRNLDAVPIHDLQVSFAYPGNLDVELRDAAATLPVLAGHRTEQVHLTLALGPGAPDLLDLELWVEGARFETIARWPLPLAIDGRVVELSPPRLSARHWPTSAPVGSLKLPVSVEAPDGVDHVVVRANGDKVLWASGGGPRVAVEAEVDIRPGYNVVVVEVGARVPIAEVWTIRGVEPPVTVDAED